MNSFAWKIGGPAGYGIKSTGKVFAKTLLKDGYNVFAYYEYPSLVRGGHNTCNVQISSSKIHSCSRHVDLFVVLDKLSLDMMGLDCVCGQSVVLYEQKLTEFIPKKGKFKSLAVPFSDIAGKIGKVIMRNAVSLGASAALMGLDKNIFNKAIGVYYQKLGIKIIKQNIQAVGAGYEYVLNNYVPEHQAGAKKFSLIKHVKTNKQRLFITGNEAAALGAIAGGCDYFSAYPMTPATGILHYLHAKQRDTGMVVHQSEDEIAALISAEGASFAGARSMTATSGGGFALMNEGVSLAGMTETGVVVMDVMRPGPATGLPTWTEQGDLDYAVSAGHGDFPRAVLAAGDPEEAYLLTSEALNIAEEYQMPVILLSDKYLAESFYTWETSSKYDIKIKRGKLLDKADKDYKRYKVNPSGVSARTIPGVSNGVFVANSDEHNEFGYSVEGFDGDRIRQVLKRDAKLKSFLKSVPVPKIFGPKKADLTLVGWGSTKGPALDAVGIFNKSSKNKINYLHFKYLFPLPKEKIYKILAKASRLLLVENNYSGQLGKLLCREVCFDIPNSLNKFDGRQFFPEEINEKVEELLKQN